MKTLTALSLLLTPLAACVQALPDLVERQEAVCGDAVVSGHLCILTESGRLFCRGSNSPVGLLSHSETPFYDALVEVQPWVANE